MTRSTERRKQQRLEKLGTNEPRCAICGETDWRCMELHHVAGRKHDQLTTIVCWNCHRKISDDQKDHPVSGVGSDDLLAAAGNFMIGLADMLRLIVEKLYEFGHALIERANALRPQLSGAAS